MVEVIPVINVPTFEEVKERVKKVEPYVSWCHLDVTDGVFSKHATWHDPRDLPNLTTSQVVRFEVHLMVENPEKAIDQWLVAPVKRVIVHLEAAKDMDFIIGRCRRADVEVGLAINPETFWGRLEPWFGKVDMVQTLAVHPGPSGQELREEIYDKVIHIRKACAGCIIEVDGGINPETAKKAREAGANVLAAGAYIFNSANIKQAIAELRDAASP